MKNLFYIFLLSVFCTSCAKNDALNVVDESGKVENTGQSVNSSEKEELMSDFASVLSKVTYERQDVREFLKEEAVKQFDKNYDILYAGIKDQKINGTSFRDIMAAYSSDEILSNIEAKLPLLNILFPEIKMFDISPENYDPGDNEIPVAVSKKSDTSLFFNGDCTDNLAKGQIPDFHVLVVNENSRVIINPRTRSGGQVYSFKSPNYDGTNKESEVATRGFWQGGLWTVGYKAMAAYRYFYKDDASDHSMALQRDYIYYGITPEKQSGALNPNVSEYISFIEINPNAYFKIADQIRTGSNNDDPYIVNNSASIEKRDFTADELIDKMWTKGAYDFRIEVTTSTRQTPQVLYIPLKPNEIWNFNLNKTYRHRTFFRHTKFTYSIDPDKFTSKRVALTSRRISFGKWNLAEEALYRDVTFLEEDEGLQIDYSYTYETTKVNANKFSGDVKLELGLGKNKLTGGVSTEASSSNTVKEKNNVTVRRIEKSDDLGHVRIYFYDPIIENNFFGGSRKHTYNTGTVTFGIAVF